MPISADPGRERYGPTIRAAAGYQKALQKHNLASYLMDSANDHTSIKDATLRFLDQYPQITGIVSLGDTVGIYDAIQTKGLKLPTDISFVGLGNDKDAQMTVPFPTTILFPSWQMGYESGMILIDGLENSHNEVVQNLLEPKLIARQSSSSPKLSSTWQETT